MARSDITTIIPLDRAAKILGVDGFKFNQIFTLRHPETNAADSIWFQTAWQKVGQAARDDLAITLRQAEDLTIKYLGYSPVPIWIESEEHRIAKPYNVGVGSTGHNSRWQKKSIRADLGYIIHAGVRGKTLIDDAVTIVYSDADGDGYSEKATVSVVTTVTDAQEIRAFFPGYLGEDSWEIRPIDVSLAAGTATITFPRYLVPDPNLWIKDPDDDDPVWRAIDGDQLSNFITTVDVYRIYNDPSTNATLYNEDGGSENCVDCEQDTGTACLQIRDARLGLFTYSPADWDVDDEEWQSGSFGHWDADRILINYRSGTINRKMKYPYLQMDPLWERAIVYYAYTNMDRVTSQTENTRNIWKVMSEDLAKVQPDRSYALSQKDLENPLGTTRAAIDLWRMIEQYRLV